MLPSPFDFEIPSGLGDDTAWLGRDVMQALQLMRRHLNTEPQRVGLAYTVDAIWRNHTEIPVRRAQVQAFRER
jgi:nuclear transport factor 2 (NTF2) superfamily protein